MYLGLELTCTLSTALDCKRVGYDAGWLQSFRRQNVELVSSPIKAVTEKGIETADGQFHELDVIVWATGFHVTDTGVGLSHGVFGEDGVELSEKYKSRGGAYGYLGVALPDVRLLPIDLRLCVTLSLCSRQVPNYFAVLGPNSIASVALVPNPGPPSLPLTFPSLRSMSWGYTIGNNVSASTEAQTISVSNAALCGVFRLNSLRDSSAASTTTTCPPSSPNLLSSTTSIDMSSLASRTASGTVPNAETRGTRIRHRRKSRCRHHGAQVSRSAANNEDARRIKGPRLMKPFSAAELWAQTRRIQWENWSCRRQGRDGHAREVDIQTPWNWTPIGFVTDWIAEWQRRKFESAMIKK